VITNGVDRVSSSRMIYRFVQLVEPDYCVVGAVEEGRVLLVEVKTLRPDIIVTEGHLPLLNDR